MSAEARSSDPLQVVLARAFAPVHKRALGLAFGATAAVGIFLLTAFHLTVASPDAPNIALLSQYFYGYDVTWRGALLGAWWGFVSGFVAGWFLAFLRNFSMATWLLVVKARADLSTTKDFLDHI